MTRLCEFKDVYASLSLSSDAALDAAKGELMINAQIIFFKFLQL